VSDQPDATRPEDVDSGVAVAPSGSGDLADPLQQPLEGWLTLADVVSEVSPSLADLMVVIADLAKVVAQEQMPGLLDWLVGQLQLSGDAYQGILNAIRANAFPLRAKVLVEELAAIYRGLPEDVTALIESSPYGLADAVTAQFLKTDRVPRGDDQFRQCLEEYTYLGTPPQVLLKASCSLEQPSLLGPTEAPVDCASLAHPVLRDRVSVAEFTYGQLLADSFKGKVLEPGPVGDPRKIDLKQKTGYRKDIDALDVEFFWSSARPPVNSWSYTIHVTEGTQFQRASETAAKLLEDHRAKISSEVESRVKSASEEIKPLITPVLASIGVAATVANPIMSGVAVLAAAAASGVVKFVVDKVIKGLRGSNLTTWTIGHTVVIGSEWVPLSVFTLAHAGTPNLCRLTTDAGGRPQASDYPYDQDLWRKARFMLGVTDDKATSFDHRYFAVVADKGRPLAWHDPRETRGGFRVLLPHTGINSTGKYVTAVRADIRLG